MQTSDTVTVGDTLVSDDTLSHDTDWVRNPDSVYYFSRLAIDGRVSALFGLTPNSSMRIEYLDTQSGISSNGVDSGSASVIEAFLPITYWKPYVRVSIDGIALDFPGATAVAGISLSALGDLTSSDTVKVDFVSTAELSRAETLVAAGQSLVVAMEQAAMAEVISKILYPSDNHPEGKSLRLKQQYFLVSASVQDIVKRHLRHYSTMENFAEKNAIHINDTHPTLAIPELMRILLDECGYGWDDAWRIVTSTAAYTNHTVMKEALECWSEDLIRTLIPRIYQIIKEIDNRYRSFIWSVTGDAGKVERMAVISGGAVRMANLCVAACHSVNGVSALHSEILKETIFRDFYTVTPDKFKNVTNGIAYRRWLCQANPELTALITELIGDKFILDADELLRLRDFRNDKGVLEMLGKIKRNNKVSFAERIARATGVQLDPDSIFDVQVKRLHEYKRQHLNAFQIISRYLAIKDNPNGDFEPHTYIFAAKAAPGYFMAKKIICFICALADLVNNDPDMRGRMKVIFVEDYNVSTAEHLMPSADISEQISLAGTEASGTGNMKLMINGAVTLGTMDGANVEIYDAVGADNILIFGMNAEEVTRLQHAGYHPGSYYQNNVEIRRVVDFINAGIGGKQFPEIGQAITNHDPYMVLADFEDYRRAQSRAVELYRDQPLWNRMSLMNISGAGRFAADRAVREYAQTIWNA